ncbi:MAG: hypothetical protein AAF926_06560 [Pseudomonadota bacterium]
MSTVFTGEVLIVEDNIIIAMDAELLVTDLGAAETHIANDCETALKQLESGTISAAILDFNLDEETSVLIADALVIAGIPFVFATGYSDKSVLPERYQSHVMLSKPYTADDIRDAFLSLKDSAADG